LELNIGDHCHEEDGGLSEEFLQEICSDVRCKEIKLIVKQCPEISANLCALIGKYISPKIAEIHVVDCPALSWTNHLKRMLENCGSGSSSVQVINICKNKWVDDWVVEQLTVKFGKSLVQLNLEQTGVTDQALHHVSRRCNALRSLTLNNCGKITDDGLGELARKVHLSQLHISHNVNITDTGIECLLSASHNLESIQLRNLPKITDRSMEAMFEAVVAWGKKRNTKSLSLKTLVLEDCVSLTHHSLVFLSTAVPNLLTLDLRNCMDIDLAKGLRELERLPSLEALFIGPTPRLLSAEEILDVMQSILCHAARLKTLHLLNIQGFDDESVSEIVEAAVVLEELVLTEMPVGIHAVESICSNVPNLEVICIEGKCKRVSYTVLCCAVLW
jgi:uncharacterized protein YneF (UPF0154 family)